MIRETPLRSVMKSLSYRLAGTVVTALVVFAATRRWSVALAVGGVDMVSKLILFYAHERAWDGIRFGREPVVPVVIWLTGFSGAGKTTLAVLLVEALRRQGLLAENVDGDSMRRLLPQSGFSRAERDEQVRRAAMLAHYLERNGIFTIVSLISPYEESRRFARGICANFIEVHVSTPLSVCEGRDDKGLYARARSGELKSFTGVSDPYEAPVKPDLAVDTSKMTKEEAVAAILKAAKL